MTPEEVQRIVVDTIQEWFPRYPDGDHWAVTDDRDDESLTIRIGGEETERFCIQVEVKRLSEEP